MEVEVQQNAAELDAALEPATLLSPLPSPAQLPGRPPGTEPLIACAPFPHPPPPGSAVRPWVKPFVAASDAASSPPKGSEPRVLSVPSVWEPLTPQASHGPMPGYDQCFQGA